MHPPRYLRVARALAVAIIAAEANACEAPLYCECWIAADAAVDGVDVARVPESQIGHYSPHYGSCTATEVDAGCQSIRQITGPLMPPDSLSTFA